MLFKKIILLAVIFMFLASGPAFSQTDREVIIMVEPGTIILPVGKISAPIDSVTINSDTLNSVLISFNPELILEAFPDFNLADTIAISPFGDTIKTLDLSLVYKIQLPEGTDNQLVANTVDTLPGVIFAEPNGTTYLQSSVVPHDPYFFRQWALKDTGQFGGILYEDINATDAWEITTGNPTIKIAIIDGGVNGSHPDLSGKVSGDATYYGGHGTHVAGIASAKSNNQIGISGVDWNAQIIAKDCADRALSEESGNLDDTKIYNGIISSVNEGAAVLNGSFGHLGYKELEREAFAYAYKMNRVSVVGMGNNYLAGNPAVYPAAYGQGIIAVGASTDEGVRSSFSGTGFHIDVVAPGGTHLSSNFDEHDIYSCWPTASYIYKGGTSFATPHVTGLASLLKGYKSDLFNDDIEQIIKISADDVNYLTKPGWDDELGAGRINARKALEYLQFPYSLVQLNIPQGYDHDTVTVYFMRFYDTPGLPQGVQFPHMERHEIRQHVDFIHPFVSPPYGWGRGAATQKGYSAERLNFGMGFCDVVPGSMTTTDCNLYTYTYKNYSDWYPGQPWETNFFYTLLGEYRLDVGATRSAQSVSPYIAVGWNDAYTNEGGYQTGKKRCHE
jgi:subtilisin family serine protease